LPERAEGRSPVGTENNSIGALDSEDQSHGIGV
jgi:hypothetical protein